MTCWTCLLNFILVLDFLGSSSSCHLVHPASQKVYLFYLSRTISYTSLGNSGMATNNLCNTQASSFLHLLPSTPSQLMQAWKLFALSGKFLSHRLWTLPEELVLLLLLCSPLPSLSPIVRHLYWALWHDYTLLISCSLFFLFLPTWDKFSFVFFCSRNWLWSKDRTNSIQWNL